MSLTTTRFDLVTNLGTPAKNLVQPNVALICLNYIVYLIVVLLRFRAVIQQLQDENEELMKDNRLAGSQQNQTKVRYPIIKSCHYFVFSIYCVLYSKARPI